MQERIILRIDQQNKRKCLPVKMNANMFYNLPAELHSHILNNLTLSQAKTFAFANKKTNNILLFNYLFWMNKYEGENKEDALLLRTTESFREKLKNIFINRWYVKFCIDEVRTVINTDQSDITHLKKTDDCIYSSSDDQTIKMFRNYRLEKVLMWHKGGIWALDVNKNFMVSGSTDKTGKIWDLRLKLPLYTLRGHRSTIRCLKISNDYIITGGRDADIRVWNFFGENLHVLKGHSQSVRCMDIYNNLLVTGSYDGTVILWDYQKGKRICNLKSHSKRVYSVLINEKFVISGSQESAIFVSNLQGELLYNFQEHRSIVAWLSVVKINFKNYLYSSGADGDIIKWDLDLGIVVYIIHKKRHITSMKIWNELLVISTNDGVDLHDAQTGKMVRNLLSNTILVYEVLFENNSIIIGYKTFTETNILVLDYRKLLN